jgi:hypothetical protein
MESVIKHDKGEIEIKRIDEVDGKKQITSSITIYEDKIILEQMNNITYFGIYE